MGFRNQLSFGVIRKHVGSSGVGHGLFLTGSGIRIRHIRCVMMTIIN
jgi:hypothetical protein